MSSMTYGEALTRHGVEIPEHLHADAQVPFLSGSQRQGDLLIVPCTPHTSYDPRTVLRGSMQVVTGEATGNTHFLDGEEGVMADRQSDDSVIVYVPDGAVATLTHTDEHGANGIAPGMYEIRRQREQADETRTVSD